MAAPMPGRALLRRFRCPTFTAYRNHRPKRKWASTLPAVSGPQVALRYFDSVYSLQLADWPALRVALLSEQKYGAMVNVFSRTEAVMANLEALHSTDFLSEAHLVMAESPGTDMTPADSSFHQAEQKRREMVTSACGGALSCYTFPRGDISRFPSPRADTLGLLEYYLMDAASLLPVLALNVQPDQRVLDLCAAPGGKTVALLMHNCGFLAANDISISRTNRLRRVLHSYVPRHLRTEERVQVTSWDGTEWAEHGSYDRVLVDAPCTTDRHSLTEDENNIFTRLRTRERQTLPALQTKLLLSGLRAVVPGGQVVYSTCSLSPLQNEFVVERALELAAAEYGIDATIAELRPLRQIFRKTFNFHEECRIGELVTPHLTANFGPMYFCLLRRGR
ncbi:PREDICTED: 5-methylcytosine rRNA methyltransferase NSUN4 [Nanorana parkeri]|uniref:5-methylcytosine rRNA methyltransferase NSUN4 n=1 Tax=Nanorana parkeri TaxID=125878 RepID=UPI000853F5F2|nr:PREDICTED: 5-methylcytosine rRNA methyltransferase NSUN4 [Nanorana parkeri]